MSDPNSSSITSEELDLGLNILQVITNQSKRCYCKIVQEYFQFSQACIIPRAFFDSMSGQIIGPEDKPHYNLGTDTLSSLAEDISACTAIEPLYDGSQSTARSYFDLFAGENMRWESIGLFCALIASSAMFQPRDSKLLASWEERENIISNMAKASSLCVEMWRKNGSTNDVVILLLYQDLMVISQLYGDKDHRTWRRLVDLAGAVHEAGLQCDMADPDIPAYLSNMRLCIFGAAYVIDKTICNALGRPPMISYRSFSPKLPLDLSIEEYEPLNQDEKANVDAGGWSSSGQYCPVTWIRLRYIINRTGETLRKSWGTDHDTKVEATVTILERYSQMWDNLPDHVKYPNLTFESHADEHANDTRMLLASIYLEYLFIKLQANDKIHRSDDTFMLALEMLKITLRLNELRASSLEIPRGYSFVLVRYGIPAAHTLLGHQALFEMVTETNGSGRPLWGKLINDLVAFIARLNFVLLRLEDENSDAIENARDKLVIHFNAVKDRIRSQEIDGETIESLFWPSSFVNLETFYTEQKDDIWRV
ncbi:hypothetical protein F4805DRAFT_432941 [Annulohypoxylon moriforme]|nr:hypothetical protein F4805DRAFT_432941 [Annulohypoxylon moriforme]